MADVEQEEVVMTEAEVADVVVVAIEGLAGVMVAEATDANVLLPIATVGHMVLVGIGAGIATIQLKAISGTPPLITS